MTIRILILDEGFMSGALAAVGLRDAGCDVEIHAAVGGDATATTPGLRWSLAPPLESPGFDRWIADVVDARCIDVVYPVTEPLQARCWSATASWSARVFRCVPDAHRPLLADKAALSLAAEREGVRIPEQVPLHDDGDVARAVARLGLPLVVKGVRGRGGTNTTICDDAAACRVAFERLREHGIESIAQRYVAGPTLLDGGVFQDGRPLRLYAGEKTLQHPPRTGPAVQIRSVRDADAIDAALRVFAMLRFTGLGSIDLVRGSEGAHFLELNPRPWGSLAAARDAGVDCFTPLAALLAGASPVPDLHFATGVESRVFPLYVLASRYSWNPIYMMRALAQDLRGPQGDAWRPVRQGWHLLRRLQAVQRRWPG